MNTKAYVGRFAPSPTGSLHLGSLLTAVASFLDARAHQGTWLVRIEDLDPPREVPGASTDILRTLDAFELHWDQDVCYQSQRSSLYQEAVDQLLRRGLAYFCDCSRSQIQAANQRLNRSPNHYPGSCRSVHSPPRKPYAIRIRVEDSSISFTDRIQGLITDNLQNSQGDFIIKRKEGFFAYHLAVALDDAAQGISHVVRGSDLLEATLCQRHLQNSLHLSTPDYAHIPIIRNPLGQKLSKQTGATALVLKQPAKPLLHCLRLLGLDPPVELAAEKPTQLLAWATAHWSERRIPRHLAWQSPVS